MTNYLSLPLRSGAASRWWRSLRAVRWAVVAATGVAIGAAVLGAQTPTFAQEGPDLSGAWVIDREASQFPREIGFGASFVPTPEDAGGSARGRGGRRGGGGSPSGLSPALRPQGESYDDGRRRELLTEEVRTPPAHLTVVDTPDAVTFTDDKGDVRTLHPHGRAETLQIDGVPVLATSHREGGKFIVLYAVADLRQVRYSFSRSLSPARLEVDIEFLERGKGDVLRHVYTLPAPVTTTAGANGVSGHPAAGRVGDAAAAPIPRANAEFTGLSRIGIVVEELSSLSTSCGLKRDEIEAAVTKPFTEAGIRAVRNGDEDTYLYVNIMTSTLPTGMCISRWDWSINSTTEATLSYQRKPLLAQVLLAKKGGLSGSLPATHGADLVRGMMDGLTQVAGMIRDANK